MASSDNFAERSHYFLAFMLKYESSYLVKDNVLSKYIRLYPDCESSYVWSLRDCPSMLVAQWFERKALDLQILEGSKF